MGGVIASRREVAARQRLKAGPAVSAEALSRSCETKRCSVYRCQRALPRLLFSVDVRKTRNALMSAGRFQSGTGAALTPTRISNG